MVIISGQKYIFHFASLLTLKFVSANKLTENEINPFDSYLNDIENPIEYLKNSDIYKSNVIEDNDDIRKLLRTKKDLNDNKQKTDSIANFTSNVIEETITEIFINNTSILTQINESNSDVLSSVNHTDITSPMPHNYSNTSTQNYTNTSSSLAPIIIITSVYDNNTAESDSKVTKINIAVKNDSNDSYQPITVQTTSQQPFITESAYSETSDTLFLTSLRSTQSTKESQSTTELVIKDSPSTKTSDYELVNDEKKLIEGLLPCELDTSIECIDKQLIKCFGNGYIDCGSYRKRSVNNEDYTIENIDDSLFKLSLEKNSQSDSIINSKCIINGYLDCNRNPEQMKKLCTGRGSCVPIQTPQHKPIQMQWWKIGLIAALSAAGATVFIIVAVIAYISWNKLKVRPELPMNGYHNSTQHNTRV